MTQEEKAKRYDEVLEELRGLLECIHEEKREILEEDITSIFPELKESSDERIRQELIAIYSVGAKANMKTGDIPDKDIVAWLEKQSEQTPATWSKEDEQNLNDCLGFIPDEFLRRWLTDAIHTKYDKPTEWSEDDEKIRKAIIDLLTIMWCNSQDDVCGVHVEDAIDWLEKQGGHNPAPAWSEEDKDFMYDTLSNLTELKDRYGEGYGNVGKCIDWLKSLKERYTWKPSDEQMDALEYHLKHTNENSRLYKETKKLYEQLKKLK